MEDDFWLNDPYDVLTADQIKVEAAAHEAITIKQFIQAGLL
jgi:hypothetical protein